MTTLQPPFDDCLFALSTISHLLEYPRPLKHSSLQQKHLKVLNLLALLLITEPNSDVAATTLIRTTRSVTILFSKNRPCTAPESSYIQTLQDIITSTTRETSSIEDTCRHALSLVIDNCSGKVKARLNKLVNRLKSGFTANPPSPDTSTLLWERLQSTGFPSPSDIPLEKSIAHWLTALRNAPTRALAGTRASSTLFIAYAIGHTPGIDSVIDDPVLLRRLQKLGDYFAAVCCLVEGYSELEPRLTITIREIAPPPPEIITLKYDILGTVNAWASHRVHHPLTPESLLSAYPSLTSLFVPPPSTDWIVPPDNPPPRTVTTSVHAECTLLTHLLTLKLPLLELGTSKSVCWACGSFIAALGKSYTGTIHLSGRQGKVHAGWRFPEGTSVAVRDAVEQCLSHEMDIVLARAARARRSDSEPSGYDQKRNVFKTTVGEILSEEFWSAVE
ncbi:hypothetical protein P167DRAFT_565279 [Morchella conica CCBAS932]|uniref:Uncharacterized protein n=1 Tax=Morchella conica CCBAS932 TaxID=1392247 RepID=A0A3N4KSC3_9PEZI|nr:hypothetical protein P167DRAFT_565279 [Morchella conica CCBAS932]